ncbi:MAG: hypothetical protein FDZ75_06380, partial [Actinobacteria bacterium]
MSLRRVLSVALAVALAVPMGIMPASPALAAGRLTATITPSAARPSTGWYAGAVSLSLVASDTSVPPAADLGFNTVVVGPGGSVATTDYAGTTNTVVPFSAEGTYTVTLTASSTVEATTAVSTFSFGIDKGKPITTPDVVAAYSGPATITLTPRDRPVGTIAAGSGVSQTYWRILPAASFSAGRIVPVPVAAGNYTLQYYSIDNAGNREDTGTANFTVNPYDSTPPTTTAVNLPAGWSKNDVPVTLSAVDASSAIKWTKYSLDGAAETTYTGSFMITKEGTTTLSYRSCDASNNIETSKTASVRIDKTLPSLVATGGGTYEG